MATGEEERETASGLGMAYGKQDAEKIGVPNSNIPNMNNLPFKYVLKAALKTSNFGDLNK